MEPPKFAADPRIFDRQYDGGSGKWAISIHLYGASPEIKDLYPWLEGEFANYTVREVEKPCGVTLEGVGECEVEVFLNGESMGKVKLSAGNILRPHLSEKVVIPARAEQTMKFTLLLCKEVYMVLYKYRSDSKFTENIFKNKQVWLATPDTLNDPFECSYNIPLNLMQAHIESSCKAQISGFAFTCAMFAQKGRTPFDIPQNEIDEFWRSLKPVFTIKEDYRLFREFQKKHGLSFSDQESTFNQLKKAVKEVGIFSLSSEIDNQLLWAHYADESRGIAIGFCVTSDSKLSSSEHCFKVEYSDDISEKRDLGFIKQVNFNLEYDDNLPQKMRFSNTTKIPLRDPFFQQVISTKPTAWSYEREWRYVEETAGLFPLPAPICEVVFGLRVKQETIEKYKKLAIESNDNIQFFQMKKSPNKNILEKCLIQ